MAPISTQAPNPAHNPEFGAHPFPPKKLDRNPAAGLYVCSSAFNLRRGANAEFHSNRRRWRARRPHRAMGDRGTVDVKSTFRMVLGTGLGIVVTGMVLYHAGQGTFGEGAQKLARQVTEGYGV